MISKKAKIVCSVKVSRLEFLSLPNAEKFQLIFYKLRCVEPWSQETDSLKTRAELAVIHTYVGNQAILSSKCKPTKEKGSEDCLWTRIFTFL